MKPLEEAHVLVVEDNPDTLQTVHDVLESRTEVKFVVKEASSLKSAEATLAQGGIDAVLLDLTLPDAQGVEVISRVLVVNPSVGVVVLTGSSDLEELAKRAGAGEFIQKPGEPDKISEKLQYVILRKKQKEEKYQMDMAFSQLQDVVSRLVAFRKEKEVDPEEAKRLKALDKGMAAIEKLEGLAFAKGVKSETDKTPKGSDQ